MVASFPSDGLLARFRFQVWMPLLFAVAASQHALSAPEFPEKPNIILILSDDVGLEALGCYGGSSYKTPNLDRMAKRGIRYEHVYSMPSCHPTRVCLLSGKYPFRLKNPKWGTYPRAAENQTLAAAMKRNGYRTAVVGKWQLSLLGKDLSQPHRMGFDYYSVFGWHEGPRYFEPMIYENGKLRADVEKRYGPDVYRESLVEFIKQPSDRPFFVYYSMALCHDVTDDLDAPVPQGPNNRYLDYGEMVESMDAQVGKLIDALEKLGLRQSTLLLFTGDNGTPSRMITRVKDGKLIRESFSSVRNGKRVVGGKTKLSDAGTRVPLIAEWPGVIGKGQVSNDLVDFADFYATCLELAGAEKDESLDGISFASTYSGKNGERSIAYSQKGKQFWVRTQQFKLYHNGRLFDLQNDPEETKPLNGQTDVRGKLKRYADALLK